MRTSDIFLFGGPIVLGLFGWSAAWLSVRADRRRLERQNRQGAAE